MADGGNNSSVVAIFAIFIIVAMAAFFAWQGGMFGGKKGGPDIEVNVPAPSK